MLFRSVIYLLSLRSLDSASTAWRFLSPRWSTWRWDLDQRSRQRVCPPEAFEGFTIKFRKSWSARTVNRIFSKYRRRRCTAHISARNSSSVLSCPRSELESERDHNQTGVAVSFGCSCSGTHPTCTSHALVSEVCRRSALSSANTDSNKNLCWSIFIISSSSSFEAKWNDWSTWGFLMSGEAVLAELTTSCLKTTLLPTKVFGSIKFRDAMSPLM